MSKTKLNIRPLTPLIGAEITGIDLAGGLDDEAYQGLRKALLDHLVIVLPGQRIDPVVCG